MSKLVFLGEKFGGREYLFAAEKTTVGRGEQNTIAIRDDSVSSVHCEFLVNGPEVIVHDLRSANGTFVNGVRVNGQRQVKSGQLVRFGSVEARLELQQQYSDDTSSEQTAVHAMGRAMDEQRRERKHPKPTDISMKLESGAGPEMGDHTVHLTRTIPAEENQANSTPAPKESPPPPAANKLGIAMAAIVAVGLALLACWWVWWRK